MKPWQVYFAAFWLSSHFTISLGQGSDCTEYGNRTIEAVVGWPVFLSCDRLVDKCDDLYGLDTTAYCSMVDVETGATIFNVSYNPSDSYYDDTGLEVSHKITEVTNGTPTEILVAISADGLCCSQEIILHVSEPENVTCQEFSGVTVRTLDQDTTGYTLLCEPLSDSSQYAIVNEFDVTWYYNCDDTDLPDGVRRDGKNLLIETVDYRSHPGTYTCSIRNNGEERFLISHQVCVKPLAVSDFVTIKCPEVRPVDEGKTVVITCPIDIGVGDMTSDTYTMRFFPLLSNGSLDLSKDNISCTSFLGGNRTVREDERISCIFSYDTADASDLECFPYIPNKTEWERERNKSISSLVMSYEIKELRREEFGVYLSEVVNRESQAIANDTTIVQERDHTDRTALIIGCTVGAVVLFIIIVAIIYFAFHLEIRCWWRHTRCSKVEKNPREYGAYLAYYWNREAEPTQEMEDISLMWRSMTLFLGKIGCPVYDEAQKMQNGFRWNTIKQAQLNSDRVIVLLTPQFIKVEETNFELYAGFNDTPYIFIKTPGTEESIKQIQRPEARNALRLHLQRSTVINWQPRDKRTLREDPHVGYLPKRFRMKLELSMPKRPEERNVVLYENGNAEIVRNHRDTRA